MWEMVEGYQTAGTYSTDAASGHYRFTESIKKAGPDSTKITQPVFTSVFDEELAKIPYREKMPSSDPADFPNVSEEDAKKIDETAKQLESLVLYQLLKQMWDTIPEGTLFAAGPAEKMYREMWLEQMAGSAVQQGSVLGIAEMVERELLDKENRSVSLEEAALGLYMDGRLAEDEQSENTKELRSLRQDLMHDRARSANPYGYLSGYTAGIE